MKRGKMLLDFATCDSETIYKVLLGSVVPRPIAWVSTMSSTGIANLAPFSFFTVASCNPPILCFAPAFKPTPVDGLPVPKDTLRNIYESKEFVVNIVSLDLAEKMNQTGGEYSSETNEFTVANLTALSSTYVGAPRVGESLINMECRLHQIIEFGQQPGAGNLVLGRILAVHLHPDVYKNGRIDLDVLQPIGRLAGKQYCKVEGIFELERIQVNP